MKKQIRIQALYATSLLAIAVYGLPAHAALTKVAAQPKAEQAIVEDTITPEAAPEAAEAEVVLKPKAAKSSKTVVQKTVVREQTETTPAEAELPAAAVAPVAAPASKPTMGSQLDAGIKTKMEDVQTQFEQALLKTLDRIKITVDDGVPAQGSATPTQAAVVNDSLVATQAAPSNADYMPVDKAPVVADDDLDADGESVAAQPEADKKSERKVRIAPVFGKSNINSSAYNISSRYTAGVELEMDVEANFALVLGYSYSQYDIALAGASPFVSYYQPYGGFNNTNSLAYNQNLFEAGMRLYLMPAEKKFRIFGGLGVGYNLGYLNYAQAAQSAYQQNPYLTNQADYEVKAWMGILSTGAAFNVSENVSLGALFKYALVFSSSENQQINNYAFVNQFNYGSPNDKTVVGGSLAKENFYSILGTVKVAF